MDQIKYPDAYDEDLTPIIARTVILPFILPALMYVKFHAPNDSRAAS